MKTIKIRVPNKSYDKEMEVIDAVSALLSKMRKTLNVEIQQGQGGTLDDWKEVDFGNKDGRLMVIKVSLRDKKVLIKDAGKHYKRALKDYNRFFKVKKLGFSAHYPLLLAKMEPDKAKSLLNRGAFI